MPKPLHGLIIGSCCALATVFAAPAAAQDRPAPAVDVSTGWAGFVDDATIHHWVFGGGARFYVTPRLSIGPELVYMIGPDDDRDLIVTGNVIFDFLKPSGGRPRRVTPYVLGGGGFFQHRDRFATGTFTSTEGAFTVGGGVRAFITDRVYVAPEVRFGWEPHFRAGVTVGLGF
jgi:Outer membrane protein beta-barrel domain